VGSTAAPRIAALLTAVATAIVIVAVSILPFLSPPWVSFEQARAQADLWTGYTPSELNAATGAILSDLVFGPPNFDVAVGGAPVLNEREQAHMRDVRGVFAGFAALAVLAFAGLVVAYAGARRLGHPERWWRAVRAGALGLVVGVVIAGVVAFFAFDALFEIFHRLFFAGGTYLFDPRTDRLVQLFPFAFWDETTMALGAVIIVAALLVAFVAGRRARAVDAHEPGAASVGRPEAQARPGSEPVS
jgi:integral membrane protein (TIGR01906 family)